ADGHRGDGRGRPRRQHWRRRRHPARSAAGTGRAAAHAAAQGVPAVPHPRLGQYRAAGLRQRGRPAADRARRPCAAGRAARGGAALRPRPLRGRTLGAAHAGPGPAAAWRRDHRRARPDRSAPPPARARVRAGAAGPGRAGAADSGLGSGVGPAGRGRRGRLRTIGGDRPGGRAVNAERKPWTVPMLAQAKQDGRKLAMLTAYDAGFARTMDAAGIDLVLVGDSLGMVVQGRGSTLPVSVDDIVYHTRCVAAGLSRALLVSDLPFQADATPGRALDASTRFLQAGATMVKLEGAGHKLETIAYLVEREIPVCAHLGLTPQSVLRFGGFKV